jgi:predicted dehydrogenase
VTGRLAQAWPRPRAPRPIVVLGGGGIVRAAHLPAYRRLGLPVAGVFDLDRRRAAVLADDFHLPRVFTTLEQALAVEDALFDVAVPADAVLGLVRALPRGSAVLVQKPLGRDLPEARRILAVARRRRLTAAMNFQLRFSPNVLALADAIERGWLGTIRDVEVRVNTHTPWELWRFMRGIPRLEILYHSIHYLDLLRRLLGEPSGVHATAKRDPGRSKHADVRSTIALEYPGPLRVSLYTNHSHVFGARHAASTLKVEGTSGAAVCRMGVNLDYPKGRPDTLELALGSKPWKAVALRGSWFTQAFEGPMSNLQRFVAGEDEALVSPLDDAARSMALVEACYRSAARGGEPIPRV